MAVEYVNIHTHRRGTGIYILDISDGKAFEEGSLCSYGVHPLYIKKGEDMRELERKVLAGSIVAIGEVGLDRNSTIAMDVQADLFRRAIMFSEAKELPLIIHCVRAFPELIAIYKELKVRQPWIIHGYNNNEAILRQLLDHGFYVSAGKALFYAHSNIRKLLSQIPSDRLFLETDDSAYTIEEIYGEAALLSGKTVADLREEIYENYMACFGRKS